MVGRRLFLAIALCYCAHLAFAGTIKAEVRASSIVAGAPFEIFVTLSGRDIGDLVRPKIDGAEMDSVPSYTAERLEVRNNSASTVRMLGYMITADKAGRLVIPPFTCKIDGETVESQPLELTVLQSSVPPNAKRAALDIGDLLFATSSTDKKEAYQGEPIKLSLEIWKLEEGLDISGRILAQNFPTVTGFYAVPREPDDGPRRDGERNGHTYQVLPFEQTLYPTTSGDLEIGAWSCDIALAVRRDVVTRSLQTDPLKVKVKPLPPAPANFSGSVGTYAIKAAVSRADGIQGVPLVLTLSVRGNGNPGAVGAPVLPSLSWAYVGESERRQPANLAVDANGYDYIYKLTPLEPGDLTIPAIEYGYFEPGSGSYTVAKSDPITLRIRSSGEQAEHSIVGVGDEHKSAPALDDLLPIVTAPGPLNRSGDKTLLTTLIAITPVVAYLIFAIYIRRQRRFATDRRFARAYHALPKGLSGLETVGNTPRSTDALYVATARFLADEFDLPDAGMTSEDAQQLFLTRRVPEDIAGGFLKILKTCERARYAAIALSHDEIHALTEGAKVSMERLDQHLKNAAKT